MSRKLRIQLIRPPLIRPDHHFTGLDTFPPLHLAYLNAALRQKGHHCEIVDGQASAKITKLTARHQIIVGMTIDQLVSAVPDDVDVVGVNCMYTYTWFYDREIVRAVRARFPKIKIVAGGEHATACPEEIMKECPAIDAVFLGEAEASLTLAIENFADTGSFGAVPGMLSRNERGEATRTHSSLRMSRIDRVDAIPSPDWTGVDLDYYLGAKCGITQKEKPSLPIIATRGCPHSCHFCTVPNMWGNRWIPRSAESVVQEMRDYRDRYGVRHFDFIDLTLVINRKWVVQFCNELERANLGVTWALPIGTRSEALDQELIDQMAHSGLTHILFSAESASKETIEAINKKLNPDHLAMCLRSAVGANLIVKLVFINGFPEQHWHDVWANWKYIVFAAWVGIHDVVSLGFVPYPGTEFYDRLKAEGRLEEGFDYIYLNNDLKGMRSWSPSFSDQRLRQISAFSMAMFYFFQFLFRPMRFLRTFFRMLTFRAPRTNFELILSNRLRGVFSFMKAGT